MSEVKKHDYAVIFDMDGVLVDTGEFHRQSWYDLSAREGFEISDDFFDSTFGMQNYQIMPKLAKREVGKEEMRELSEWKESRYRELITGKMEPLEGVIGLLGELKKAGFRLAIGTSTPEVNLRFLLAEIPEMDVFDAYVSGEEVRNGKPAPDTFLAAAKKLGVEPGRCVVVEDAVVGVEAGKAAGMKVAAVTTTHEARYLGKADIVVESLARLGAGDFKRLLNGERH